MRIAIPVLGIIDIEPLQPICGSWTI